MYTVSIFTTRTGSAVTIFLDFTYLPNIEDKKHFYSCTGKKIVKHIPEPDILQLQQLATNIYDVHMKERKGKIENVYIRFFSIIYS